MDARALSGRSDTSLAHHGVVGPATLHAGAAIVLAALGVSGCASLPKAARDAFVTSAVCPANRVTVAPSAAPPPPTPPAEIAADPERLRVWRDARRNDTTDWTYFEVSGCGQRQTVKCLGNAGDDGAFCIQDIGDQLAALRSRLAPGALSAPVSPDDSAHLASLPHILPHYDVPSVPKELRGLSVRLHAGILGATSDGFTEANARHECVAVVEGYCALLGWTVVTDPGAAADLDIDFSCSGHVIPTLMGNSLEIRMPDESADASTRFKHAGVVIETFPRGPSDFVCESSGSPMDIARDCVDRAKQFARTRFVGDAAKSHALRDFATNVHDHPQP